MTGQTRIPVPVDQITAFCKRWGVVELALFGSVLRADFGPKSDVDVLVRFGDEVRYTLFDLASMTDELEAIFGRKVDVIDRQAVEGSPNYIRRKHILGSAEVIYAA